MAIAARRRTPGEVAETGALPWQDAFEIVPVPLWMMGPGADLRRGNRAWHALTAGGNAVPWRGTQWLQAVHQDDRGRAVAAFGAASRSRRRVDLDLRLQSPDGYGWWSLVGAPSYTAAGEVDVFIGAATDLRAERESRRRLHELGGRLVAAQETERARIARELHDDLAQRVALVISHLGSLRRLRPFSTMRVRRALDEAREMLRELTSGIHLLSYELHPAKLRLLGLGPTLTALCQQVARASGVLVHFHDDESHSVTEDAALCVFRVAQEALQNAIKHSGARRIDVRLSDEATRLRLWVADHGRGFDPGVGYDSGLGLMTMRERVDLVGGCFRVVSTPGCGTIVEAVVPMQPVTDRAS